MKLLLASVVIFYAGFAAGWVICALLAASKRR